MWVTVSAVAPYHPARLFVVGFASVVILPLHADCSPLHVLLAIGRQTLMREASHIFNPCDLSAANKIRSVRA